jgi:hypothetical protein
MLVSCLVYFSAPKIETICSSEMSVDFQLTTRRYIPWLWEPHIRHYEHSLCKHRSTQNLILTHELECREVLNYTLVCQDAER